MTLRAVVPQRMSRLAAAGTALAALVMLPGWALPGIPEGPFPRQVAELQNVTVGSTLQIRSTPENEPEPVDLEKECSFHFEHQVLATIIDYLADYSGCNFVMDSRVIPAVSKLVEPGFMPSPPGIKTPPNFPTQPINAPLPPGSKKPAETARDYATLGIVDYINLQKVPLRKVLDELLTPMNLSYRVVGSVVFISTPEKLAKADPKAPALRPDEEAFAKKLNARIPLKSDNERLRQVFKYFRAHLGVDCKGDPEARLPRTHRPVEEAVVSYMKLEQVPLWETLYWLTLTTDLTYLVKGDAVWVTTPDRASEAGK